MINFNYLSFNITYFIILYFIFFLGYKVESFNPEARYVHSSVLVGSRIYFFGGEKIDSKSVNEVFYLDVSQEFHIASAPWTDLTASAAIPFLSSWATVTAREVNNDSIIYLFGGYMLDPTTSRDSFTSLIHTFNTTSTQWSTPQIQGTVPSRRRNIDSVLDDSGYMYIFGGYFVVPTEPPQNMFNDMIIINTNTLSISPGATQKGPSQRCAYTATLLPNGTIVYIGGYKTPSNGESPIVNITEIYLYDTKLDSWSLTRAGNINSIESRYLHTAVLAFDDGIVIYGGVKDALGSQYIKVAPDFAVLNTSTFEWIVPQVSSNIGSIPSLTGHSANLVGNYMVLAFGNITRPDAPTSDRNPNIYLMDTRNYTWVDTFDSKSLQRNQNHNNTKIIIIATLCGVAGIGIIAIIIVLIYRRNKRRKGILEIDGSKRSDEILKIAGSESESNYIEKSRNLKIIK